MPKVEKVYDVSNKAVAKAVAPKSDYCSEQKVRDIKADLTRHLAGDFTPSPPRQVEEDDGGLFGGPKVTDDADARNGTSTGPMGAGPTVNPNN